MNFTLTTLVISVIGFIMIKFATRFLYKLLGFAILAAVVVYLMFHFGLGPFKQNPVSIYTLEAKYCDAEKNDLKCTCIVQKVRADIDKRWTQDELQEMRKNREMMGYVFKKSFEKAKPEILKCLAQNNGEHVLKEFQNDLIPIENELIEKISTLKKDVTEKSMQMLDSIVNSKESVDDRYNR